MDAAKPKPRAFIPWKPPSQPGRGPIYGVMLGLVLLTCIPFAQVGSYEFLSLDDPDYISLNLHVRRGLVPDSLVWDFTHVVAGNYHPLTMLTHRLDVELWGRYNSGGHHLTNLALHLANVGLLFFWFVRATGRLWPSALVAALFAWHPLRAESVAWVAERKDVLSIFFGLVAMHCYLSFLPKRAVLMYLGMLAALAASLLSKATLVTFPFLLLLLDGFPLGRWSLDQSWRELLATGKSLLWEKLPLFVVIVVECIVAFYAQNHDAAVMGLDRMGILGRMANVSLGYLGYVEKYVWPAGLSPFYPLLDHRLHAGNAIAGAIGLLAVTLALAWLVTLTGKLYLLVGWLWFLGTMVPMVGLVQIGSQCMADRYTYFPMIGVNVMVAWFLVDLVADQPRWKNWIFSGTALWLVVLLGLAVRQVSFWRNTETLMIQSLAVQDHNHLAHRSLAFEYREQGRLSEAIEQFRRAMKETDILVARVAMAQTYLDMYQLEEAHTEFARIYSELPDKVRYRAYMLWLRTAKEMRDGEKFEAIVSVGEQDFTSDELVANARALYLYHAGRSEEAVAFCRRLLGHSPAANSLRSTLARILAASPDENVRDPDAAFREAKMMVQFTQTADASDLDHLAMALAANGQFERAAKYQRDAIRMVEPRSEEDKLRRVFRAELEARLALYERGQVFIDQPLWPDPSVESIPQNHQESAASPAESASSNP